MTGTTYRRLPPEWDEFCAEGEARREADYVGQRMVDHVLANYERVSEQWADFIDSNPARPTGLPVFTVDRYGGMYSMTRVPRRRWRDRLRDFVAWLFLLEPDPAPYDWEREGDYPPPLVESLALAQLVRNQAARPMMDYMRGDQL